MQNIMDLLILFLILSFSLLEYAHATITIPSEECKALQDLHRLTQGKAWRYKWSLAPTEHCQTACDWFGVTCNKERNHITKL